MKVLWLTTENSIKINQKKQSGYNGCGWVTSLQQILQKLRFCNLGIVYITNEDHEITINENVTYYPIKKTKENAFTKFIHYNGGFKNIDNSKFILPLKKIIEDFKPDLIHLFGLENPLASILGNIQTPIVVHLQGLLAPIDNAFFPININKSSFLFPITLREWILRNGLIYAKKNMAIRGINEIKLFEKLNYVMGRTEWDFKITKLLSPDSTYFHVDEVLRPDFYNYSGKWVAHNRNKMIIISTISETVYKGLDLILKTAKLLKDHSNFDFEWRVIGINKNSDFIRFFEKSTKIKSENVNITYQGVLNATELCLQQLEADLYIHPSYIDNSPNSVCEAQLLGLPVIATNVGGVSTLVEHSINGFLVPANGTYEMCYYIQLLYNNNTLIEKISNNAKMKALTRHDRNKILSDLIDCYLKIIKNSSSNHN